MAHPNAAAAGVQPAQAGSGQAARAPPSGGSHSVSLTEIIRSNIVLTYMFRVPFGGGLQAWVRLGRA